MKAPATKRPAVRWLVTAVSALALGAIGIAVWSASRDTAAYPGQLIRFEPDPAQGYSWPFLLYLPPAPASPATRAKKLALLVIPNNTGEPSDDFAVHERAARETIGHYHDFPDKLSVPLLVPIFPRPWLLKNQTDLYVHALDSATLRSDLPGLKRVDLQLLAMINHARIRLANQGWNLDRRALLMGFSASGMFANRFTVLHPDKVLAVAVGAPGGWPVAPVATYQDHRLDWPLGVANLEDLTGEPFDEEAFKRVPQLLYLGSEDANDAVDQANSQLVATLFGATPLSRWPVAAGIYASRDSLSEFRIQPGTGHAISPETWRYQISLFSTILEELQTKN